jgi:uridine kinase
VDVKKAAGLVVDLVANCPGRPSIVAIDGPSAAGTSTLAGTVRRWLGASVVASDDVYRDLPERRRAALTPGEGVDQYFDWQRLRDEALRPLRSRGSGSRRR